jgi:hypothetical protein
MQAIALVHFSIVIMGNLFLHPAGFCPCSASSRSFLQSIPGTDSDDFALDVSQSPNWDFDLVFDFGRIPSSAAKVLRMGAERRDAKRGWKG